MRDYTYCQSTLSNNPSDRTVDKAPPMRVLAEKRAQRASMRERLSERERKPSVAMDLRSSGEAERSKTKFDPLLESSAQDGDGHMASRLRETESSMTIATRRRFPFLGGEGGGEAEGSKIIDIFISLKSGERGLQVAE